MISDSNVDSHAILMIYLIILASINKTRHVNPIYYLEPTQNT